MLDKLSKGMVYLGGAGAIAYLSLCALLWLGQRRLIFKPSPLLNWTPAHAGVPYEDVTIAVGTEKGYLHGWFLPAQGRDTGLTVLYLHGNGGNIGSNLGQAQRFQAMGLSVLLMDYRGYGRSSGPFPSEQRVYEDAAAAWYFLRQNYQLDPSDIIIYGHSIGGAVAIHLAQQMEDAAGLVVESSFTTMEGMAQVRGYDRWVPVPLLLHQQFDSLAKVRSLRMPIFFIHGLADQTIPATMTQQLYDQAHAPKRLWLVPAADHNDLSSLAGLAYEEQWQAFIQDLVLEVSSQRH